VEAMGRFVTPGTGIPVAGGGPLVSLSRIHITVKDGPGRAPGRGTAVWIPDDSPRPNPV
jgi:hypothetical protein